MLHLAAKAFAPQQIPFPVMHIDTGYDFPEVLSLRDQLVQDAGVKLLVESVQAGIDAGELQETAENTRNRLQTKVLLKAIKREGFTAAFGGARRDEDRARAKERIVSRRTVSGKWDPLNQQPELWGVLNVQTLPGEHVRAFPISNWREVDIWRYIAQEKLQVPRLYFAHEREVIARQDLLLAAGGHNDCRPGEKIEKRMVRFRTMGDMTLTGCVESEAADVAAIISELEASALSERGATRADDRFSDAAMEDRKREGYF